jgi:NAD(P)-dependent dehydrogenase (short-subunit alcohol dehydrogenase family)
VSSAAAYIPSAGITAYDASKAGNEHFASALRQEVAHLGVDVGSAHMSWIDTPLVQEGKTEVSSFNDLMGSLPGPLKKTTSVQ